MTINAYGYGSYSTTRAGARFVQMRRELDDLTRQLATKQRSVSYGGLGSGSGTSLDLRAKLSSLGGYRANIESAEVRLKLMSQGIDTLAKMSSDVRSTLRLDNFSLDADGKTLTQRMAREQLELAREVLNQESGGRYLFAGRSPEKPPVAALDDILNGAGGRLGLSQMIPERTAADRGPGNLGHATITMPGTSLAVSTTDAARPGIKITGITENLTGATATFGTTAGVTTAQLDFTADPVAGETFTLEVALPDGTTRALTFTAEAGPGSGAPNTFVVGGGAAASRNSANAAVTSAIQALVVSGDMQTSSAIAASRELFNSSPQNPLPAGAYSAPVVDWYVGDDATQPSARDTALVQTDATQNVGIGARANEPAFAEMMAQLAVLSVESFTDTPADKARFQSFAGKIDLDLAPDPDEPGLQQIATELGFAQAALKSADDRHAATESMLTDTLAEIEQASPEETAAILLSLQTRLQASYQTTALLSQLSLVNYL